MKEPATFDQAVDFLKFVQDQGLEKNALQAFRDRGLISTLLMCNPYTINYVDLQILLGIRRIVECGVHRDDWAPKDLLEAGRYDAVDPIFWRGNHSRISEFQHLGPLPRTQGPTDIHDIHFNKPLRLKKVIDRLKNWGLRPADITEFLSFGTTQESWGVTKGDLSYRQCYITIGSWLQLNGQTKGFPTINYTADRILTLTQDNVLSESSDGIEFPAHLHFIAVEI
jgi:hypothetical protein